MPHLLATSQEMKRGNADQESSAVLRDQFALDLIDLRTHRTAKRDTTCIGDIEPHHRARLRHGASGGLQRIATHQSRCDYDAR